MGFPDQVVLLIAGVYTIMDFGATVVNVLGDTVGMTFIASKL
ncbi:MAG: cation:dicarboxylase symporter family transporter, partial [Lachnospira sp.]|nr:cation:dicarboxylase symporter family transporter [Lachnospira sp.]